MILTLSSFGCFSSGFYFREFVCHGSTSDQVYLGSKNVLKASFDETTQCAQAFRVLKQLIQSCLADVCKSKNIYADSILQRLSWWLCSPCSKLHDPALQVMLHKWSHFPCHWFLCFASHSDIFDWIELEPVHFCHSLIFMDQVSSR